MIPPSENENQGAGVDINLFAGAGGLALGLRQAGFSPVAMYERDKLACSTLRCNTSPAGGTLRGEVMETDVRDLGWHRGTSDIRLIAAGFPCQPFSSGGKHLAERDGRNLFPEVASAVRQLRPRAVLLENVRGLLRHAFSPYFQYMIRQLEFPCVEPKPNELWQDHDERIKTYARSPRHEPDYHVEYAVLDAADFGVPQNRARVFIVATRSDICRYSFPNTTHSRSSLLLAQRSGEYWERHRIPSPATQPGNGAEPDLEDERLPWVTVRDLLRELPEPADRESDAQQNHWTIHGARTYPGHTASILDWPSKTIKAGVHGVPGGENAVLVEGAVRYYTLREAACVQSFPHGHLFEGSRSAVTRQIGNAVPPELAAAVAKPLNGMLARRSPGGGSGE